MAIAGVAAAKKPQRLAQLVYVVDAYLPIEGENEITPWSTPIEAMDRISYHVKLTVS
jgi:hypothetical protein